MKQGAVLRGSQAKKRKIGKEENLTRGRIIVRDHLRCVLRAKPFDKKEAKKKKKKKKEVAGGRK